MEGVGLVTVQCASERPVLDLSTAPKNPPESVHPLGGPRTVTRGDVGQGLRDAAVHVEHQYTTPIENHNPMEVHNTVAVWEGGTLTLYTSTQGIFSVRNTVAQAFGLQPD